MSFEPPQEDIKTSPIIQARSLLLSGDETRAFAILKEGAAHGDVMACYDFGFFMTQGIGCARDWRTGIKMMERGMKLEEESKQNFKPDDSITKILEPQLLYLRGLFPILQYFFSSSFFLGASIGDFEIHPLSFELCVNSSVTQLDLKFLTFSLL